MTDNVPPFALDLPEGFHPLPLTMAGAERQQAVFDLVKGMYPGGNADLWSALAPMVAAATELTADADLTLAAIGLFGDGPGKVVQCALTLAVAPSSHPTAEAAARGIREILDRTSSVDAQYVDLPCGPAAVGISMRQVTYDGDYTTTGEPASVRMARFQAYVPFPDDPYIAALTLDTPAVAYVENFSVMMGTLLTSLEFPIVAERGPGPSQ